MSKNNQAITAADISRLLEEYAPTALQEEYDNSGLIIGRPDMVLTGVMIAFDVTEQTVAEAVGAGCNMIVSHHPLIFRGLKRLNGATTTERAVMAALRADMAIYAAHTSADNAIGGVSMLLAERLGLLDVRVLDRRRGSHLKLSVFVPRDHASSLRAALAQAGAGGQGAYSECSFSVDGNGSFRPLDGSNPYVGTAGELHVEPETRIEMLLPAWLKSKVEQALRANHPYEEPAYEFIAVDTPADSVYGSGAIGSLPEPTTMADFAALVKERLGCPALRCSRFDESTAISRVALCGGSGAFLIANAERAGAQAFVTADVKYHDFVDASPSMLLVDAGHFETEKCITEHFYRLISKKFPNFAVRLSETETNPVRYL